MIFAHGWRIEVQRRSDSAFGRWQDSPCVLQPGQGEDAQYPLRRLFDREELAVEGDDGIVAVLVDREELAVVIGLMRQVDEDPDAGGVHELDVGQVQQQSRGVTQCVLAAVEQFVSAGQIDRSGKAEPNRTRGARFAGDRQIHIGDFS